MSTPMHTHTGSQMDGEQALEKLLAGNQRYIQEKLQHPNQVIERMKALTTGQQPFAIIVGCSDSRVPPEIIFDQGLGDLFITRLAGNVVDEAALGSIEYAVAHLNVPLIVVLGHEKCGAVAAAVEGGEAPGNLSTLMKLLKPAVEKVKDLPGNMVENAAKANVQLTVEALKVSNSILAERVQQGKLQVEGAYYRLDTGVVEIF